MNITEIKPGQIIAFKPHEWSTRRTAMTVEVVDRSGSHTTFIAGRRYMIGHGLICRDERATVIFNDVEVDLLGEVPSA